MKNHKLSTIHVEYSSNDAPIYHCVICGVIVMFDQYLRTEPKDTRKDELMYVISGSKNHDKSAVMKYLIDNKITCNAVMIHRTMIE